MKSRSIVLLVLVVLLLAASIAPVLAAVQTPTSGRTTTLIYTASSKYSPQGMMGSGGYMRLATDDCPAPMRMLIDGQYVWVCPPSVKLPPIK